MESAWKKRMVGDPEHTAKRAIAVDAYNSGCLIYSTATGKWYTPEKFMEADQERVSIHRGRDDAEKFKIMHPRACLKQKAAALRKAEEDLQYHLQMITENFDFINLPERKKKN